MLTATMTVRVDLGAAAVSVSVSVSVSVVAGDRRDKDLGAVKSSGSSVSNMGDSIIGNSDLPSESVNKEITKEIDSYDTTI